MKGALRLRLIYLGGDGRERAMIGDRDPGTDGDRNRHVTRACVHADFNRRTAANSQMFSCESRIGAIVPEVTPSGGTTSGTSVAGCSANRGCSTRVAITAAVNSSAAARK